MEDKHHKYEASKILLDVSHAVSSSLDLEKVTRLALNESRKALGADHASLFLIDEKLKRLVLAEAEGFSSDEVENLKLLGSWEVINDYLVKKKKPMIVNDVHRNAIFSTK